MSWKEKLKTLCSEWFITREEVNSTGTVIFISNDSFQFSYNEEVIPINQLYLFGSYCCIGYIELPYGSYYCEAPEERAGYIVEGNREGSILVNKKIMFVGANQFIEGGHVTTQQEI